ncbi:MAG: peroxiredoxin [Oscillospiraceae bacterium]|nr:peroxiredoxin [Oscillospiraceae bacterium]
MLTCGIKAPDISLPDQNGEIFDLAAHNGKTLVYFYSKDSTSGCTKQALGFAELNERFKELGVKVIGISKDTVASHAKFAQKNSLPFTLLADPELSALKDYDVWHEKTRCGKTSMGTVRSTYLIDENGMIEKVWADVKADKNPGEVLAYLEGKQ